MGDAATKTVFKIQTLPLHIVYLNTKRLKSSLKKAKKKAAKIDLSTCGIGAATRASNISAIPFFCLSAT